MSQDSRYQFNNNDWQMPNFGNSVSSVGMPNYQSKMLQDISMGQAPGGNNAGVDLNQPYSMNTSMDQMNITNPANPNGGNDWQDKWLGEGGLGSLALGGANTLLNGYLGFKQLGMAKDQLQESKRQFNMNWGAQKKTTNNQLHGAQERRNQSYSDPSNRKDMAEYMDKWGIE